VAKSPSVTNSSKEGGQVLAFFALVLPMVLLPVAAYAVDATIVAGREAGLQAATAQAAESAAQQLNAAALRSSGALTLNTSAVTLVANQTLVDEEPGATVDASTISGVEVTLVTSESVTLLFSVFTRSVTLHTRATARLAPGYDRPSQAAK
jgi:hypothetical protein